MTDEMSAKRSRFERAAEVFARVRRSVPAEREALLDLECGDDRALRDEVRSLLAEHVETPAAPVAVVPGIPGFRILRRIGAGGMGTVYEAEQERPRRRVALKVMRFDALSDESLARFEIEASALARLQHPGVARVFQTGRFAGPAGDLPYLVMELVDGPPITKYAERLDRDGRLRLLIEVCDAVAHAHQRGILHRDLKPANILVAEDGRPRVLDFGMARELEEPSLHTRSGHVLGTPSYMSPEQAGGDFRDVDVRCDVYALGVLAYELVSGAVPHDVRGLPLLEAMRVVAERPHRSLGADDLSIVIDKALAKDRDRRYATASSLADDLRRVRSHEPVRARPPSRVYHLRRFVRRNRAIVATVAIAVVALVAALIQAVGAARYARAQQAVASRARYAAQLQAATSYLELSDVEGVRALLADTEPKQRGWMWDHLDGATDGDVADWQFADEVRLVHGFDPSRPVFWSAGGAHGPDGELGIRSAESGQTPFAAPDGTLLGVQDGAVLRLGKDSARPLFRIEGHLSFLVFGPSGRRVAVATQRESGGRLALRDAGTGRVVWERDTDVLCDAVFSPDGGRITAISRWNGGALQWDAADGRPLRKWRAHTSHATRLVVAPRTGMLATWGMDWSIRVWSPDGERISSIDEPGRPVHALAFSPDGKVLASGQANGTVRFSDPLSGRMLWASAGRTAADVSRIVWTPDGEGVYCEAGRGIYLRSTRRTLARRTRRDHATAADGNPYPYVYDVAYSRDGALLASVGWDKTARIVDVASGRLLRTIALPDLVECCRFGRDGILYVSFHGAGGTGAWDAATGRRLAFTKLRSTRIAVRPDGGDIAVAAAGGIYRLHPTTLAPLAEPVEVDGKHGVWACAYAPDGRSIACGTVGGDVCVVRDGGIVLRWRAHPAWIRTVAWSPDSRRVVAGSEKGHVATYSAADGRRLGGFTIPGLRVFALQHSPDGRLLFVGSDEHTIRVWDTEAGQGVGRLSGHAAYVKGLALSPDGETLASASGDNTVRLWHRRTERERR